MFNVYAFKFNENGECLSESLLFKYKWEKRKYLKQIFYVKHTHNAGRTKSPRYAVIYKDNDVTDIQHAKSIIRKEIKSKENK